MALPSPCSLPYVFIFRKKLYTYDRLRAHGYTSRKVCFKNTYYKTKTTKKKNNHDDTVFKPTYYNFWKSSRIVVRLRRPAQLNIRISKRIKKKKKLYNHFSALTIWCVYTYGYILWTAANIEINRFTKTIELRSRSRGGFFLLPGFGSFHTAAAKSKTRRRRSPFGFCAVFFSGWSAGSATATLTKFRRLDLGPSYGQFLKDRQSIQSTSSFSTSDIHGNFSVKNRRFSVLGLFFSAAQCRTDKSVVITSRAVIGLKTFPTVHIVAAFSTNVSVSTW